MRDPSLSQLRAFSRYNPSLEVALKYVDALRGFLALPDEVIDRIVLTSKTEAELATRIRDAWQAQAQQEPTREEQLVEALTAIHREAQAGVQDPDPGRFQTIAEGVESVLPHLQRLQG